jgi:hypothetical protein
MICTAPRHRRCRDPDQHWAPKRHAGPAGNGGKLTERPARADAQCLCGGPDVSNRKIVTVEDVNAPSLRPVRQAYGHSGCRMIQGFD